MSAESPATKPTTGSLEEQRDFLLDSLRDLERDRAAGDISEADHLELKDDYTARAAAVLRAMEAGPPPATRRVTPSRRAPSARARTAGTRARATGTRARATGARATGTRARATGARATGARAARARSAAPPAPPSVPHRRRSLLVTLGVALTIIAIAGGSVAIFSDSRDAGQPLTGSLPVTPAERLSQAIRLDSEGKALEALKLYDAVLVDDPGNVQALAYKGWLLKRAGLVDKAQESLDKAVAIDPRFPDAHFFRGMLLFQDRNDPAGAVVEFRTFLDNDPPQEMVPAVQDVLKRAEAEAAARTSAP